MKTNTLSLKKTSETKPGKSDTAGPAIKLKVKKQKSNAPSESLALERHEEISKAAYYRAEECGFQSGHERLYWLEAEKEIDRQQGKSS